MLIVALGLLNVFADPVRREAQVELADWPAGQRPLRLALLSDIHMGGPVMDEARLARIVGQVNEARPDLVLIAGDFVNGHGPDGAERRAARLATPLAGIRAPLGAVAVLGNHDHWTNPASVSRALEAAGIAVLENEAIQRGPVTVIGVGDAFTGHDRIERALGAARALRGPKLVLTHSPDLAPKLPSTISLLLAGHTHCGQIVLPILGPVTTRAPHLGWRRLYDPRFRCGLVLDGARSVVVTAGVGAGTLPFRIGAVPDWWLVTVGPGARAAAR
jgi:uncharacterized protein